MEEILYKRVRDNKEILKRGFQMKEQELNTMMSVVTDPINNVYRVHNYAEAEEIRRMCRVFEISNSQQNKHKMLDIKNMATMKLVLSNN